MTTSRGRYHTIRTLSSCDVVALLRMRLFGWLGAWSRRLKYGDSLAHYGSTVYLCTDLDLFLVLVFHLPLASADRSTSSMLPYPTLCLCSVGRGRCEVKDYTIHAGPSITTPG